MKLTFQCHCNTTLAVLSLMGLDKIRIYSMEARSLSEAMHKLLEESEQLLKKYLILILFSNYINIHSYWSIMSHDLIKGKGVRKINKTVGARKLNLLSWVPYV
jgi:hypothetical protein